MPDIRLPESFQTFDWFILGLRIVFIFLVYFFLYQVARVTIRELVTLGTITSGETAIRSTLPSPASSLELIDPAGSSWESGISFPLDHYTTIGRNPGNSVELDDDFVSGSHAEIFFEDGQWWLQDLTSTNGTFLNSVRVGGRTPLTNGDIVQCGRVQFRALL